ncbi:uncharacterized protein Pyn_00514 [Prunus yedoensis var. nudiflora]|uniref:Uncharacterized protein n=1 Tax=Prunus yedoensis var. nudiflora TaxID=2094558 RepID=A0A314YSJ5_PRUYE|nr:uncharacterized protein Pyn_00514 [Prunus yedoensis var. nudiflora]
MPSGDMRPLKVPVSKNMLDSHLKGKLFRKVRRMVTLIIVDGQFPQGRGLTSPQYTIAIRLSPDPSLPSESLSHQQSARLLLSGINCHGAGERGPSWILFSPSKADCREYP